MKLLRGERVRRSGLSSARPRALRRALAAALLGGCISMAWAQRDSGLAGKPLETQDDLDRSIRHLLRTYCTPCHGSDAREGGLSITELDLRAADEEDLELWRIIRERVKFGEMPPRGAQQPSDEQRATLLAWIRAELLKTQRSGCDDCVTLDAPRDGNYVDHAALFDDEAGPVIPGPPRVWRLRPQIYNELVGGGGPAAGLQDLSAPLNVERGLEFRDWAGQYFIDEPTTSQLLANAEKIVRLRSRSELALLTASDEPPSEQTVFEAIRKTFLGILRRQPRAAESARFHKLYRSVLRSSGSRLAAERLLIAIYMQPEVLFREELGQGQPDRDGRVRLSQREIAFAISYALGNSPDEMLLDAAKRGELATRRQVAEHVRRRLDSPPDGAANPRMLEFFREYFGYSSASEVFKDRPKRGRHLPDMLVTDLDLLIEYILEKDQSVLFELLTTNEYFVDCRRDPETGGLMQSSVERPEQPDPLGGRNPEHAAVYGLSRDWIWTARQPVATPARMRAGVLTHPAWLVAWSGNFDNRPVQRGKWIRTRLLGGSVPSVPIGVDATVPEDRQKQFRERITLATARAECQRCHKKMDPLGLPFEQYSHYGRFRIRELGRPVDTSGSITFVDDPQLVGEVSNAVEMMHRLAKSEHVEQVFVRYAFRYFMGRNETLGDAKSLQDAHRAYSENGGSFQSLVVSLLASDSFLYRLSAPSKRSSP